MCLKFELQCKCTYELVSIGVLEVKSLATRFTPWLITGNTGGAQEGPGRRVGGHSGEAAYLAKDAYSTRNCRSVLLSGLSESLHHLVKDRAA